MRTVWRTLPGRRAGPGYRPAYPRGLFWIGLGTGFGYGIYRWIRRRPRPRSEVPIPARPPQTAPEPPRDAVEQGSWESFPASDPPSTMSPATSLRDRRFEE